VCPSRLWPRLRSVRSRAAIGAALATAAVFAAAGLLVREGVRAEWMADARNQAYQDAQRTADDVSGNPLGIVGLRSPWVLVLEDGRIAGTFGTISPYVRVLADEGALAPAPADLESAVEWRSVPFPPASGPKPGPEVPGGLAGRTLTVAVTATPRLPARRVASVTNGLATRSQRMTVYVLVAPEGADAAVAAVERLFRFGLPFAALFAALVAWVVTGRALRPVEAIRARLAEITASAVDQRVPVPASTDEIAELARTTNSTLERLEHALVAQRRFVADASHELRSPLANLRNALEVPMAYPDDADWEAAVAGALTDVDRLQRLTDDLLVLALDEAPQPPTSPVDLGGIVAEQVAERAHAGRGPAFTAEVAAPALVTGSEVQLGRIVGNLLDNAARHAGSAVAVTVAAEAGQVVLTVTDDGPGIPAAERERIFERFVRLDAARSRATGGAGLGLTIVRGLVTRLGGSVRAMDAPGGGACFELRLPAADQPRA
jgi:signal transduction histidine kinase